MAAQTRLLLAAFIFKRGGKHGGMYTNSTVWEAGELGDEQWERRGTGRSIHYDQARLLYARKTDEPPPDHMNQAACRPIARESAKQLVTASALNRFLSGGSDIRSYSLECVPMQKQSTGQPMIVSAPLATYVCECSGHPNSTEGLLAVGLLFGMSGAVAGLEMNHVIHSSVRS